MTLAVPKRLKTFQTKSHAAAPRQERRIARELGGQRVKGSGCGAEKGDVRLKGIARIECKTTAKKSFTVTREMIEKLEKVALAAGEFPALCVDMLDDNGKPVHQCAIVPMYVLSALIEVSRDATNGRSFPDSAEAATADGTADILGKPLAAE